jgi:hypothetical protein
MVGAEAPLVALAASASPLASGCVPFLSPAGLLNTGGPIVGIVGGVMSMGSRGGVSVDGPEDEGRMGIGLSSWKGLRRISAMEAMARCDSAVTMTVTVWEVRNSARTSGLPYIIICAGRMARRVVEDAAPSSAAELRDG